MTAVYLVLAVQFSPAFFLGTLGALLLVSRPRSIREWFWILICGGALAAWLQLPDTLMNSTLRASSAFVVGVFVALSVARMQPLLSRALGAVFVGGVAMVGWYAFYHLRFATLENDLITQTWEMWRQVIPTLPAAMPPGGDILSESDITDQARRFASILTFGAAVLPAYIALNALAGVRLAWSWYQRIARVPILPPARPLRDFRFNDQLIWIVVLSIGALLLTSDRAIQLAAGNLLTVLLALYVARGMAIVRSAILRASPMFVGIMLLMMLALFSVVLIGLALLGIADTWVDFRRRMAPPSGVPS